MGENQGTALACRIMDLSDRAMFVFSPDDFSVVYANTKARDIFGGNAMELLCYEAVEEKACPCKECPFLNLSTGEECIAERYFQSFNQKVRVKGNGLEWNDGRRVILCEVQETDALMQVKKQRKTAGCEQGKQSHVSGMPAGADEGIRYPETLRYHSEIDALTGLYNATRFYTEAGKMVRAEDCEHAVVSFDINRFKMINDLFGMKTGDDVLCHVANVLRQRLPEGSICCRVHSDVFFLCVPYVKKGDVIRQIEKIRKGIFHNGFSFDINTSFGVYLVQNRSVPINLMCDRATLAGRTVKNSAMKFCAFYDEHYRTEMLKTAEIEQDMNAALSNKQFVMYLQPKYDLESGRICGAEVLSRWKHPVKGLIQPKDFIPLFERNGFILRLDEYMWEEACKTLARWRKEGKIPVPLSVNISGYHIKNNDLILVWKRLIHKYDILPSDLTLEITETFFHDADNPNDVLDKLQDMGFKLEVDDFGAGYSSLNMIRNVPVNTIKMDKDFLVQKLSSDKGKIVVSHTIAMAKELQLSVVAEGVETKEHVDFLKSSDCDIAQGYFFAKPMPLEEFNTFCYDDL